MYFVSKKILKKAIGKHTNELFTYITNFFCHESIDKSKCTCVSMFHVIPYAAHSPFYIHRHPYFAISRDCMFRFVLSHDIGYICLQRDPYHSTTDPISFWFYTHISRHLHPYLFSKRRYGLLCCA